MASITKALEECFGISSQVEYDFFRAAYFNYWEDVKEALEDVFDISVDDDIIQSSNVWKEISRRVGDKDIYIEKVEVMDYLGWLNGIKFHLPNKIFTPKTFRELVKTYREVLVEPTNVTIRAFD